MKNLYRLEVEQMVGAQLEKRSIRDSHVLAAFRKVPRHEFIPDHLRGQAYADGPLPLMEGQTISQPWYGGRYDAVRPLGTGRLSAGDWHRQLLSIGHPGRGVHQ
jgi:hypothetical protein